MSESNVTDIEWETPPDHGNSGKAKYQDFADALRARPGEWAVFARAVSPAQASMVSGGGSKAFRPRGAFQGRQVSTGDGKADIYARFVGEPEGGDQ